MCVYNGGHIYREFSHSHVPVPVPVPVPCPTPYYSSIWLHITYRDHFSFYSLRRLAGLGLACIALPVENVLVITVTASVVRSSMPC